MGLLNLQKDLNSETCLRNSDLKFHWGITFPEHVILLLTRDCVSVQYSLLEVYFERILVQT